MSTDIQFGQLAEAKPQPGLRPDADARLATAPVGDPAADELPIFIDLDVLGELWTHARSNRAVELGGVLLGGQHVDDKGRPFVVIRESLRAEHYEATRGSFKFTHETWAALGRRKEQFPPELAIVGWYHTHPDWGVFLSGMDDFICEHFFNKPLDVALVIDPCRDDCGFFQWTAQPGQPQQRTGGFVLFASRFRAEEIARAAALGKEHLMPNASPQSPPAVVHVTLPASPWQHVLLGGMLSVQCLTLLAILLLVWRGPSASGVGPAVAAGDEKTERLVRQVDQLQRRDETRQQAAELAAQQRVVERALKNLSAPAAETASENERLHAEVERLRAAAAGFSAVENDRSRLERSLAQSERDRQALKDELAAAQKSATKAQQPLTEQRDKLAADAHTAESPENEPTGGLAAQAGGAGTMIAVSLLLAAGVGLAWFTWQRRTGGMHSSA